MNRWCERIVAVKSPGSGYDTILFWCFVFLIRCLLTAPESAAQELPLWHYTRDREISPLPFSAAADVFQDSQGFIWIAGSSGIARYDGQIWERYGSEDGLAGNWATVLAEDRSGRLWVAGAEGLAVSGDPLSAYTNGRRIRFENKYLGETLLSSFINPNCLVIDSRGTIWVGTDGDGIIRYNLKGTESATVDTLASALDRGGPDEPVYSILERRDGSIWAGLGDGKFIRFDENEQRFLSIDLRGDVLDATVTAMYEDTTGVLWGGTYNGRLCQIRTHDEASHLSMLDFAIGAWISDLVEVPGQGIWIASRGAGVHVLSGSTPDKLVTYTRKNGLMSDLISALTVDREGNIWMGHNQGLSKLRTTYKAFRHFTSASHAGEQPLLPAPSVTSMIPRGEAGNCLWVATEGGIACIQPDGSSDLIRREQGIDANEVYTVFPDSKNRIWVGLSGFSAVIHAPSDRPSVPGPSSATTVTLGKESWQITTFDLSNVYVVKNLPIRVHPSNSGETESLWFLSYRKVACFVDNTWFIFRQAAGYPPTSSGAVTVDDEGHVWVGTDDQGLYRSRFPLSVERLKQLKSELTSEAGDLGKVIVEPVFDRVWDKSTGAPSNSIHGLLWHEGRLWICSPGGLFIFPGGKPENVQQLNRENELPVNNVQAIAHSPVSQSLWLGTEDGLVEVDPVAIRVIRHISREDGLLDDPIAFQDGLRIGSDGVIYYGTPKGLTVYDPRLHTSNPVPPVLTIRKVVFDEDGWGNNEFSADFASLSFASERGVRYETRLVGYTDGWSNETTVASVRFTNLHAFLFPRRYRLEVRSRNADGVWSDQVAAYSFRVSPTWWESWWFALAMVGFLAGVTYGAHKLRISHVERRNTLLQEAVDRQTAELKQTLHELKVSQNQLIQAEKMASLGQLTAGIAHEIKNPLNFINNFAAISSDLVAEIDHEIKSGHIDPNGKTEEIRHLLGDLNLCVNKIVDHGHRADTIVVSMLEHSKDLRGDLESVVVNALVSEYANLAYRSFQARNEGFKVAIETHFDSQVRQVDVVPQEIGRVLINLLNNAFQAVQEKAASSGTTFIPRIVISTRAIGDNVEITVKDNGPGIPEPIRSRIFEPFFSTRPPGQGTGLGLSLAYDIVTHRYGGNLRFETEVGTGTTFTIELPLHRLEIRTIVA